MKRYTILGLLALLTIGAVRLSTITETYMPKSGAWCFEGVGWGWCGWAPVTTPSATIGPRITPTVQATLTRTATPTITALPPLVVNGSFEEPNNAGWTPFHLWEFQPVLNDERGHPESRFDGAQSLRLFNQHRCWLSGVHQTVSVTQFKTYVAFTHGRTWASHTSIFPSPSDLSVTDGVAIGVDPNGGINPSSTAIIWAEASNTEVWRLIEVQFTALANRVTIFIRARLGAIPPNACQWPLPFMVAYIDDAGIREVGTAAESAPTQAIAPLVLALTSTPTPEPPPTEPSPEPYPQPTGYP